MMALLTKPAFGAKQQSLVSEEKHTCREVGQQAKLLIGGLYEGSEASFSCSEGAKILGSFLIIQLSQLSLDLQERL